MNDDRIDCDSLDIEAKRRTMARFSFEVPVLSLRRLAKRGRSTGWRRLVWQLGGEGLLLGLMACTPGFGPEHGALVDHVELQFWNNERNVGAITEGDEAPWIWGFQGGTMIRPMLVLKESEDIWEGDEFDVVLRNEVLPDSENSDAFDPNFGQMRMQASAYIDHDNDRLVLGPIDNQLGWTSLEGLHVKMSIEVSRFAGRIDTELRLAEAESPDM